MRALITGATGFIGQQLVAKIDEPIVLTRDVGRARQRLGRAEIHAWNPMSEPAPAAALRGLDAIFNLAGDPVAEGRWTAAKKQRLLDSRVIGTQNLLRGLETIPRDDRPPVLVSASAVGYYGSRGDQVLDEHATPGPDFLADVCVAWEAASAPAAKLGLRVVNPRIGVVLGHGGALAKMLPPFRLGLGGRLADGRQYMPWIHIDDMVGLLLHAACSASLSGAMNAVAPEPVTNSVFTQAMGAALHRPVLFPVPAVMLRLALGEFAQVLLASQRVTPLAALGCGYTFKYPEIRGALESIVGNEAST
jgi:uncharacterized protein (TIGR01777 family)